MRALIVNLGVLAVFLNGCDPIGRVQLRRLSPSGPEGGTIGLEHSKTKKAFDVLDTVVVPLGFEPQPTADYLGLYVRTPFFQASSHSCFENS